MPSSSGGEVEFKQAHDAALQFIRKISGLRSPSKANRDAFDAAVEEIR